MTEIYTIGHSNHSWETFLPLLERNGIEVLVDVRSKPVSRFAPFSNKKRLPGLLESEGIGYIFMGDSLGGRPDDPSCYDANGKPDYAVMRTKPAFQEGIAELTKIAQDSRIVLMCAEDDPVKCHRRLLIGPELEKRGVTVVHVRKVGNVEAEFKPWVLM